VYVVRVKEEEEALLAILAKPGFHLREHHLKPLEGVCFEVFESSSEAPARVHVAPVRVGSCPEAGFSELSRQRGNLCAQSLEHVYPVVMRHEPGEERHVGCERRGLRNERVLEEDVLAREGVQIRRRLEGVIAIDVQIVGPQRVQRDQVDSANPGWLLPAGEQPSSERTATSAIETRRPIAALRLTRDPSLPAEAP
jgi:hypothetical protein